MNEQDCKQLLYQASLVQNEIINLGFVPKINFEDIMVLYDNMVTDKTLRETTRQLFREGHYAIAVEEGYKCLNNMVKSRTGSSADGADLMRNTFSPKKPILALNSLKTDSQINQQHGYMDIFAGCMTGIRNPRAHEHRYLDEPKVALEMLSLANHLLRLVQNAKRTRSRIRKGSSP
jgi:uncharacterized protein (TIGR02391 family)